MKIIALSGNLGCGKDFLCNNIIKPFLKKHNKTFLHMSFADQIKVDLMSNYYYSYDELFVNKTAETRQLLQQEGENKRKQDPKYWINYLSNWIEVYKNRNIDYIIITDLRYFNEYNFLQNNNALIIKIISKYYTKEKLIKETKGNEMLIDLITQHPSETQLDTVMFENVIFNEPSIPYNFIEDQFEELLLKYIRED